MSSSARPAKRLEMISKQYGFSAQNSRKQAVLSRNTSDVVITYAIRTPLTKAKKGILKGTPIEGLLVPILQAVLQNTGIDPSLVEEISVGNVLHKNAHYVARASALTAGFPPETILSVVNRWCSSGLLAVQAIANQITASTIEIGLAVGVESMSTTPDDGAPEFSDILLQDANSRDTTQPMGWTSENVAGDFGISRETHDRFASRSQQKAERARAEGWTTDEILPIRTKWTNPKTSQVEQVIADKDDGIRPGTTAQGLSEVRKAFPQWPPSATTGGNASQITDGAAAVLLMRRDVAERLGLSIRGKFVASVGVGIAPRIMGISPTLAIPKLLRRLGIDQADVDVFEINEAFASMLAYTVQKLGIGEERVNPRGGAIALGHPLGCTGTRQIVTALSELKRTQKQIAVTSMCVGTGMGMASLIVSEE